MTLIAADPVMTKSRPEPGTASVKDWQSQQHATTTTGRQGGQIDSPTKVGNGQATASAQLLGASHCHGCRQVPEPLASCRCQC